MKNARLKILEELDKLLPGEIDSFGNCHNNADSQETLKGLGLWHESLEDDRRVRRLFCRYLGNSLTMRI